MNQRQPRPKPENQNDHQAEGLDRHCGIIMPIAGMLPDYDAAHWSRVKDILSEAIIAAGFIPRLVSDSDEIGVIHGQIVQNLYDDEIVVCDVSAKNPNVMFELGMRLAFDKPTVIVKDDLTAYSFDTSPIKHIGYRKDQRFDDVEEFKRRVTTAITATMAKKKDDENFSPFLKHFGHFTPKKVENQEVPQVEFILQKLSHLEWTLNSAMSGPSRVQFKTPDLWGPSTDQVIGGVTPAESTVTHAMFDFIRSYVDGNKTGLRHGPKDRKERIADMCMRSIPNHEITGERMQQLFEYAWDRATSTA